MLGGSCDSGPGDNASEEQQVFCGPRPHRKLLDKLTWSRAPSLASSGRWRHGLGVLWAVFQSVCCLVLVFPKAVLCGAPEHHSPDHRVLTAAPAADPVAVPPLLTEAIGSRNHSEWGRMLLLGPPQCNTCISPSAASWFPTPCFPLNPPAAQSLTSGTRCAVYACFPRLSYSHSPSADLTLCRQPRLRCPLSASI